MRDTNFLGANVAGADLRGADFVSLAGAVGRPAFGPSG